MLQADELEAFSAITCPPGGWKPAAIRQEVDRLIADSLVPIQRVSLGTSFEGRPIELLSVGTGPRRVLMWSQMHGDEPTHTSVLLNLLALVARGDQPANELLAGLTLGLILPLNPDGAERNTRHNGQGIDVNRDALTFSTPEGRALRHAVETFAPRYGFNLHNQHHRTAIGTPPAPAAVSLLAPPLDPQNTQTPSVEEAARVAACFCNATYERCEGRVSRYDVEYMARAFGEWVQRQGVATILVEAGGWPGGDFLGLEQIHFAALVQTLHTIGTGAIDTVDPQAYHGLARSSEHHLFDLQLSVAGVAQQASDVLTTCDVGIDYPHRRAGWYEFRDGVIRALGDLHVNGGLSEVNAKDCVLLPGRIALVADTQGSAKPTWDQLTATGVTSFLVQVDLSANGFEQRLLDLLSQSPPLNASLVGHWAIPPVGKGAFLEQLHTAVAVGIAAVVGPLPNEELASDCRRLGLPVLNPQLVPLATDPPPASIAAWISQTTEVARELGWTSRGRIGLGTPADFVLAATPPRGPLGDCLRAVYVGGTVVRDEQGPTPHAPGRWITRGEASVAPRFSREHRLMA
ncbi:M14 family zinc carboxypeptidase [Botrimarina hoheduenensis]|uniref:Zinc carboxypeptidase n=1 Tax=Botrimarina hoheduenensis TaxID=2528000 RepID=A0A5C5WEC2_9BACT|nr:M14 family zinc carboxypeptidase [Botrimarina hoheduenensis]TWT48827.1 Zinc carboxypeptidase [Botrimarina hoheduenensis]